MRTIFKVLLWILGFLILPITALILILILKWNWWVLGGLLIFEFIVGCCISIIFLVLYLKLKKQKKEEIAVKDAKAKAILEMKYDEDNPDNFDIKNSILIKDKRGEFPPILHLDGRGTETRTKRDVIINLNEPDKEITCLINKTPEEVEICIRKMAGYPEPDVIKEEKLSLDILGRPTSTIITKQTLKDEEKKEEEKKEAESLGV